MKLMIFLAVILVFVVSCADESPDDTVVNQRNDQDDGDVRADPNADDYVGFEGVTKQQCVAAGGHWNTCGSPCAGTGADFCIEMCSVQCECSGIAGFACPEGFKCRLSGKIADEMGVCVEN
tara:strand:- start:3803 stop:4165 length:363 start_codon:yes stop_codon:yes gene_type:complete